MSQGYNDPIQGAKHGIGSASTRTPGGGGHGESTQAADPALLRRTYGDGKMFARIDAPEGEHHLADERGPAAYLRAATPPLDDLEAALAKLAARRKP